MASIIKVVLANWMRKFKAALDCKTFPIRRSSPRRSTEASGRVTPTSSARRFHRSHLRTGFCRGFDCKQDSLFLLPSTWLVRQHQTAKNVQHGKVFGRHKIISLSIRNGPQQHRGGSLLKAGPARNKEPCRWASEVLQLLQGLQGLMFLVPVPSFTDREVPPSS